MCRVAENLKLCLGPRRRGLWSPAVLALCYMLDITVQPIDKKAAISNGGCEEKASHKLENRGLWISLTEWLYSKTVTNTLMLTLGESL